MNSLAAFAVLLDQRSIPAWKICEGHLTIAYSQQ